MSPRSDESNGGGRGPEARSGSGGHQRFLGLFQWREEGRAASWGDLQPRLSAAFQPCFASESVSARKGGLRSE
jgi:hypothetical protein